VRIARRSAVDKVNGNIKGNLWRFNGIRVT
jgi:hypothetical protein